MTQPVEPLQVLPVEKSESAPLSYAGKLSTISAGQVQAARWMIALAVLSGLCVLSLGGAMVDRFLWKVVNFLVFSATLGVGIQVGILVRRHQAVPLALIVLDGLSAIALLGMAIAPLLVSGEVSTQSASLSVAIVGACFFLLAVTTFRHRLNYQMLSRWSGVAGRTRSGTGLRVLGNIKMVYEALWLFCCSLGALAVGGVEIGDVAVFAAFAAFFGCMGYGVLWIWMIVAHSMLAAGLRKGQAKAGN